MKKGIIALMACVFALSLALVGCSSGGSSSGGASSSSDPKDAWVGTWDLVEMEENGEVTGAEDLKQLKDLGLEVYLQLDEDGAGSLVLFGEAMKGAWEAKSATEGVFTIENQTVNMALDGTKLTMEQSGSKLTFEKGEARSSGSAASASAEASSASAEASESSSASS